MGDESNTSRTSRSTLIFYWITTSILVIQSIIGAWLDLTKGIAFVEIVSQLGYPLYLLNILGFWRILAIIALLIPKYPRIKEWAYAGLFFDFSGAAASHLFIGDYTGAIAPLVFALITIVSWHYRPPSRKFLLSLL